MLLLVSYIAIYICNFLCKRNKKRGKIWKNDSTKLHKILFKKHNKEFDQKKWNTSKLSELLKLSKKPQTNTSFSPAHKHTIIWKIDQLFFYHSLNRLIKPLIGQCVKFYFLNFRFKFFWKRRRKLELHLNIMEMQEDGSPRTL